MLDLRVGQIVGDRYRIDALIGSGGMGAVVSATHVEVGQRVAIKFLLDVHPQTVARFEREGRLLVRLKSPHVARVFDVGVMDDDAPYIVMEHLEGQDLADLVGAVGRVPYEEVVDYVLQACDAIAEAHALGIVHRDLKPANVFLAEEAGGPPLVKLVDFGLAKDLLDEGTSTALGTRCGSPSHMSPEQVRGDPLDGRSDLFAVGIMLFEALAGGHPFYASTIVDIATRILRAPVPSLRRARPSLPAWIEEVVLGALQKEPEWRFESAAQMQRALLATESWRQSFSGEDSATNVAILRVRASSSTTPGTR